MSINNPISEIFLKNRARNGAFLHEIPGRGFMGGGKSGAMEEPDWGSGVLPPTHYFSGRE